MSGIIDQVQKSDGKWNFAAVGIATTLAVWTPRSSARIILTGLDIVSYGANTSTVHVFFSTSLNTRGTAVGIYTLGTTAYINPRFPGLKGGLDVPLNVTTAANSVYVTAIGTEV